MSRVLALPRATAAFIDAVVCQGLGGFWIGAGAGGVAWAAGALVAVSAETEANAINPTVVVRDRNR